MYLRNLTHLKTCHLVVVLVLSCGNGGTAGQKSCKLTCSRTGHWAWRVVGFPQRRRTRSCLSMSVLNQNGRQVLQSVLTPDFVMAMLLSIHTTCLQLNIFKGYEMNNTVITQLVPCQISFLCVRCLHPLLSFI